MDQHRENCRHFFDNSARISITFRRVESRKPPPIYLSMETFIQQLTAETPYAFHIWYGPQPFDTSVCDSHTKVSENDDYSKDEETEQQNRKQESFSKKDDSATNSEEQQNYTDTDSDWKTEDDLTASDYEAESGVKKESVFSTTHDTKTKSEQQLDLDFLFLWETEDDIEEKHPTVTSTTSLPVTSRLSSFRPFERNHCVLCLVGIVLMVVMVLLSLEPYLEKEDDKEG